MGDVPRENDPAWLVEALEVANRQAAESVANQADELTALRERVAVLENALTDVVGHFKWRSHAPGHCHTLPGIWDDTGDKCEWCDQWQSARAALTKQDGDNAS